MKIKRSAASAVFDTVNVVCMALLAVVTLYPFWNVFIISISPTAEADAYGLHLWTSHPLLTGYQMVFKNQQMLISLRNTFVRTALGTVVNLALCCLVAYPLSKKYMPLRNVWTSLIVFTMFFSGGLIPSYLLVTGLGLTDTIWSMILPGAIPTYSMILVRNYFQSLPPDLEESARIDGANEIAVLLRIVIPVSVPIIATVALWSAVGHWNAWFDALLYIRTPKKVVMQLLLYRMVIQGTNEHLTQLAGSNEAEFKPAVSILKAAAIMVSSIPIICVYPFVQRYFMKGIMVGSLKG